MTVTISFAVTQRSVRNMAYKTTSLDNIILNIVQLSAGKLLTPIRSYIASNIFTNKMPAENEAIRAEGEFLTDNQRLSVS